MTDLFVDGHSKSGQSLRVASLHSRITSMIPAMILKYVGSPVNLSYLNCTNLEELVELVRTLQVDYATMGVLSPYIREIKKKLRNYDMEYNVLARCNLYAAVGPTNPLYNHCGSVATEELYPFTIISYADFSGDPNYNFAVALGIENLVRSCIRTNNAKIFYQTIHETAAVGIVAVSPENFSVMCEYDDLKLLPLHDCSLFVEYIWTKLRRVPMSDLAYEDLCTKQLF